jgi:hypothetical protein
MNSIHHTARITHLARAPAQREHHVQHRARRDVHLLRRLVVRPACLTPSAHAHAYERESEHAQLAAAEDEALLGRRHARLLLDLLLDARDLCAIDRARERERECGRAPSARAADAQLKTHAPYRPHRCRARSAPGPRSTPCASFSHGRRRRAHLLAREHLRSRPGVSGCMRDERERSGPTLTFTIILACTRRNETRRGETRRERGPARRSEREEELARRAGRERKVGGIGNLREAARGATHE